MLSPSGLSEMSRRLLLASVMLGLGYTAARTYPLPGDAIWLAAGGGIVAFIAGAIFGQGTEGLSRQPQKIMAVIAFGLMTISVIASSYR